MLRNPLQILGTGVGVEVRGADLAVALVKSRWRGVMVAATTTIRDFRARPPAEWGREYQEFVKGHGFADVPATLALPRGEAIVRLLQLPAAARAQLGSAVRYQLDSLHPYGEDGVYHSFAALEAAPAPSGAVPVAVVIASRALVDDYADRFAEAGVKLRGCTVAAAAYYGVTRLLRGKAPEPFLLVDWREAAFEIYGESAARPFFSAVFDARSVPLERAVAAAAGEMRFPDADAPPLVVCGQPFGDTGTPAAAPEQTWGAPISAPAGFDLRREATAFAVGVAAACPRFGWRTNLLPAARRSSSARWPMAVTAAAAAAAVIVALVVWLRGPIQDRGYARELESEMRRLEAVEREVQGLNQQAEAARARRRQLQAFRVRPEADLALLTEISRRLPNSVWLASIEMAEDSAQLAGQAESAAPLLGLLDSSALVTNAAFVGSIGRGEKGESFRIRAARRAAGAAIWAAQPPGR